MTFSKALLLASIAFPLMFSPLAQADDGESDHEDHATTTHDSDSHDSDSHGSETSGSETHGGESNGAENHGSEHENESENESDADGDDDSQDDLADDSGAQGNDRSEDNGDDGDDDDMPEVSKLDPSGNGATSVKPQMPLKLMGGKFKLKFAEADSNSDGTISLSELRAALELVQPTAANYNRMKDFDTNEDGVLSTPEKTKMAKVILKSLDHNNDHLISATDLK